MHAQGEAITGGIDLVDDRVELVALPADHVQHRAEYLALQLVQGLQFIGTRGEEGAVGDRLAGRRHRNQARLAVHALGVRFQHLQRVGVDHRADVGAQQAGVAQFQFGHGAGQHRHHLVGDVVLHEQHARGRTTLAGGNEGAGDCILDHRLGQRGGVGDEGVLAAGLGDQHADGGIARGHRAD